MIQIRLYSVSPHPLASWSIVRAAAAARNDQHQHSQQTEEPDSKASFHQFPSPCYMRTRVFDYSRYAVSCQPKSGDLLPVRPLRPPRVRRTCACAHTVHASTACRSRRPPLTQEARTAAREGRFGLTPHERTLQYRASGAARTGRKQEILRPQGLRMPFSGRFEAEERSAAGRHCSTAAWPRPIMPQARPRLTEHLCSPDRPC